MARPDDITDDPRAIRAVPSLGERGTETEQLRDSLGHPFVRNTDLAPGDWAVHWLDDSGEVTEVTDTRPSSFGTPLLRQHLSTADGRAVSRPVARSGSTTICTHEPHCDPYDHEEIARLQGTPTSGASPFLPSMSPRARSSR
ncbi:hypothetical protein BBK14_34230 [Parafrankia soli]|uniref:Uncharacterized protein n=1 Tax=Parafrankia soli TaxID=2599596 RepID=A0A1S1Q6Q6_9ACTN|nr:hypothetical protein [Parafrankia soli]OHV28802.1 hypothetical protein BBK14_34230 [Parafrankia soli]